MTGVQTCALPISAWCIAARPSARLALILAAQHRTVIGDFGVRLRRHTRDRILIGPIWMDALPVITVLAVKLLRVGRHDRSDRCAASKACKQAERKKRSEEHTSELQSLMRISYAVFCLKKKNTNTTQ